jgi:2-C-methyl-D-erythritol 4-phosphate cytidylyltransferase
MSNVLNHSFVLSDMLKTSDAKHFLVVSTSGKSFAKMMVYPLSEDAVIKLTIEGEKISDDVLVALSDLSSRMTVIHSSGFTFVKNRLKYEIYIAKTLTLEQFQDVQSELMQLEGIESVILEEITANQPAKEYE